MARSSPGITERHSRSCNTRNDGSCNCEPSYIGWIFDPRTKKKRYSTENHRPWRGKGARAAAKAWRSDATVAVRKGSLAEPNRRTVEQETLDWIARSEAGDVRAKGGRPLKPSVLRTYTSDLHRYVIPELGHLKVAQLRRSDVQAMVDAMIGRGLSGSRIRGCLNSLRQVLRRPLANDELVRDPTDRLDLPTGAATRQRAASPAEAARLLAALDESDRPLWATAFYAGLRRGELRALRCSDLDPALTEIHVRRGWDDVAGEVEPKSKAGTRKVPIAGTLRLVLLEHLARTGRRGDDLVFGRTATEPFTPTHVRNRALGAWTATVVGGFLSGESVDLEPIGLHECRHTFVSLMYASGVPLETIGDLAGHSAASMTDNYRHLLDASRTDAGDALDAFLQAGSGTQRGTQTLRAVATPHR